MDSISTATNANISPPDRATHIAQRERAQFQWRSTPKTQKTAPQVWVAIDFIAQVHVNQARKKARARRAFYVEA
jgi:hypothetical protein